MDSTKDVETNTAATSISGAEVAKNAHRSTKASPVFQNFLKLPAEIRSQIYHDLAACDKSGSLNLFSTSRQMRNEGAEASAQHFRFKLWLSHCCSTFAVATPHGGKQARIYDWLHTVCMLYVSI